MYTKLAVSLKYLTTRMFSFPPSQNTQYLHRLRLQQYAQVNRIHEERQSDGDYYNINICINQYKGQYFERIERESKYSLLVMDVSGVVVYSKLSSGHTGALSTLLKESLPND